MKLDEIFKKYKDGKISSEDMIVILLQIIENKNEYINLIGKFIDPTLKSINQISEIVDSALEDKI